MNNTLDNPNRPKGLRKVLGITDGIAILIGITIGAGIYSTPQIISGYLPSFPAILGLWLAAGFFVFTSGLIYAELGTRMPQTGGEYVYISRSFGPFAGFIFGWSQLFIIRTSAAAGLAMIVADYFGYFVPLTRFTRLGFAFCIIIFFGLLNYVGIQKAGLFQRISSLVKIAGLFGIAAVGVLAGGHQGLPLTESVSPTGNLGPAGNLVAAAFLIIFSHTGWERVGYSAGEMKNPKRTIPLSLLFGIGLVILLYALTNWTFHRTLGMEGMRQSTIVASDVLTILVGPAGAAIISVLVMISSAGSINGTMMTATRVYYAMARDGLFFRWLNHIHPRYRTPSRSIIVHCLWAGVILFLRGTFETIASGMVFAILIFYGMSTLALFKMRKKNIGNGDVYTVPLYPLLPILSLLIIGSLLVLRLFFEWRNSLIDIAMILTGIPFAIYWCRKGKGLKLPRDSDDKGPEMTILQDREN